MSISKIAAVSRIVFALG